MSDPSRYPQKWKYQFTVHTPTFNRAHTLQRVYDALSVQTFTDFEWLIVDDGSSDDTGALVESWRTTARFPICYIHKQQEGKPAAVMAAVEEAQGELFLILDSDDACVPNALERLAFHWQLISEKKRADFIGITSLCSDQNGVLIGDRFPEDVLDSDAVEIKYRYKLKGEKWGFLRTNVLRECPWPSASDHGFVPEGVWWTRLAKKYQTRYVNEILRIYYLEPGTDTLMNQTNPYRYPHGHMLWHQTILNDEIGWFKYQPYVFLKSAIQFCRFSQYAGNGLFRQWNQLTNNLARILWLFCLPLATAVIMIDRFRK